MANETRSGADLAFVLETGEESLGLLEESVYRLRRGREFAERPQAPWSVGAVLLNQLLRRVAQHERTSRDEFGEGLPLIAFWDQTNQLDIALRLLSLPPNEVLVTYRNGPDSLNQPALFDIFNPRARRMLSPDGDSVWDDAPPSPRDWVERASRMNPSVVQTAPWHIAAKGFMTLFTDSLVTLFRGTQNNASYVPFTVNTRNSGYQLEYHPQYNTSPQVFGTVHTTPVTDSMLIGRYHFQGRKVGGPPTPTPDPGTYVVSPMKTSATLSAF